MPTLNSATGVYESDVVIGQNLTDTATANSTATADATSVEGVATGNARITQDVGILDTTISVGADASLVVTETGVADASATTVNKLSGTGVGNFAVGDLVGDGSGGFLGYVTGISGAGTGATVTYTKFDGTTATAGSSSEQIASGAFAGFTGATGGIIDNGTSTVGTGSAASGTDVDLVIGNKATVGVTVGNTATADAVNTDGDAYGVAFLNQTYGLEEIGVSAGDNGSLAVNIDADASASAVTVGTPGAGTGSAAADAVALGKATTVVGISDLGNGTDVASSDFNFGNDATIAVTAGTSADRVTVTADATTATGVANASADLGTLAGILDAQGSGTSANIISVGDNATISSVAYGAVEANSTSTTGKSLANADTTLLAGIQSDAISIGNSGVLQAQSGITSDVTATTVNGVGAGSGTGVLVSATNDVTTATGLDLETLNVGNDATKTGSYGILGRTDVTLATTASSTGADDTLDNTIADAFVGDATGIQLGITNTNTALTVGDTSSIAGVANVTSASTASSVDGETDAVSQVGSGTTGGAVGIDLNSLFSLGSDATVLGQGLVNVDATATNIGNTGVASNANASAGASNVAGIDYDGSGTSTIGADATITALGSITADASATSITGSAQAQAGSLVSTGEFDGVGSGTLNVAGLSAADAITIGDAGTINANAMAALNATATSVGTGTATSVDADARIGSSIGLQTEEFTIGNQGTVNASSVIDGAATATSTEGTVTADAVATSNFGAQNTAATTIGNAGTITATADSGQTATSLSVTGDGSSLAETTTNIGINADGTITVGSTGSIRGNALSDNVATATSTDGDGVATATTTNNVGVDAEANLTIGSKGSLTGVANLNLDATAVTVGDSVTADVADANAGIDSNNVALSLDGTAAISTTIGATGTVIGSATLTASASATGTKADALSDVDLGQATAIDLGGAAYSSSLIIGDGGTVTASSKVTTEAAAATIDGDASSDILVDKVAGLGDGSGTATIGNGGVINALASATNTATASATDADASAVNATIDNTSVTGIDLASITAGSTLGLRADAVSTQTATASNIGDPGGADMDATATVGAADSILGITSTTITAGSDVSQLIATATLTGSATASNMSGISTASAGDDATVVALDSTSTVQIGGDARNVAFAGVSNLTAEAVSVEDSASAYAGANSTSGGFASLESIVQGVNASNITVGGSVLNGGTTPGTISATANSKVDATASTSGSATAASDATAIAAQEGIGLLNSTVTIGEDGNLLATSTLVGSAEATNVGEQGTNNAAAAYLTLDSTGLDQTQTTTIGATGNVTGQGFASGSATAQTTEGNATAAGNLDTYGVNLTSATADITIGEAGNISGLAVIGTLKNGTLGDSVEVTSSTIDGIAQSTGVFDGAGIKGTDGGANTSIGLNQTLLTAGPNDGDVSGQVLAGGSVVASSVGNSPAGTDDATATINSSTIAGIQNVDILGGQVGTNLIRGTSLGNFEATASSVYGDATGSSTTTAYGIFDADKDGFITTSGNIQAVAQLTNTVTANTVYGNAVATATADAVGLSGYNVTIIGSGALNASAVSKSTGLASSVGGNASA